MLRLYGHFASQPTRSVAWLLKLKQIPFELITTNPTAGETRAPQYRQKFPLGLIPAIEDTDSSPSFTLSEASAILIYLCEKHGWDDFYPTTMPSESSGNADVMAAIRRRAKIHEYLSHHNESARTMTRKIVRPTMVWMFNEGSNDGGRDAAAYLSSNPRDVDKAKATIRDVAKRFQHKFIASSSTTSVTGYIAGGDGPTIADLLAYPELAQIPQIMGIEYAEEWPELAPLKGWMDKMAKLPFHDDIHRTVYKIGKLYRSKL